MCVNFKLKFWEVTSVLSNHVLGYSKWVGTYLRAYLGMNHWVPTRYAYQSEQQKMILYLFGEPLLY